MLMCIDVGNTTMAVGVYQEDELIGTFRLMTDDRKTSDELGSSFMSVLTAKRLDTEKIDEVIISSVVPNMNHSLVNAIKKYFNAEPVMVSSRLKTGIDINHVPDLGADRIVDSAMAYHLYGATLVIDFGTATTYDYVNKEGRFITGITAPGIGITSDALTARAAQLPKIELVKPDSIITTETIKSMQIGIVDGYLGSVEYIIDKVREEIKEDFTVVATGGYGSLIVPYTKKIEVFDSNLAFKGMKYLYELNR